MNQLMVDLETTDDTSSLGGRLEGLQTRIQAIEDKQAELDKQIQSIKKEIAETKKAELKEETGSPIQ